MKITGNKGEWSELYAFLKLLSTGRLYAADEYTNRLDDIYFPIMRIIREENPNRKVEYVVHSDSHDVELVWNSEPVRKYSQKDIARFCAYIYSGITNGSNRSFYIDEADDIMNKLACEKIAAPSTDKTDIKMEVHDVYTGYNQICGFSIKSNLGSAPTLLNASKATNFVFEVTGVSEFEMDQINGINTDTKVLDRIKAIQKHGSLAFKGVSSKSFSGNMMMIDSCLENIIAEMLLYYYSGYSGECRSLISKLEDMNPIGYFRKGIYEYKLKKFLCSIALGMIPSKDWDGKEEANGGYVIVKDDGDVLAYHLYNRNAFETYLLNNTKLDRGSTKKHGFASLYKEDGHMYINLNLQIRFI